MLRAIKLTPLQIIKALDTLDTEVLPRHVLAELLKFIPTDEESLQLRQYENESSQLASAERFLYHVSHIPRYGEKIKALHFKTSWDELIDDTGIMISSLLNASNQLVSSKKFKEVLKVILALGNYMNGGQRGGAYGFKVGSILKVFVSNYPY